MRPNYLEKMFTQTVTWLEKVPAKSSLDAESEKVHELKRVRVSPSKKSSALSSLGEKNSSFETLYILKGTSLCDDSLALPMINMNDFVSVVMGGTKKRVSNVSYCFGVTGELKHMEVELWG